MEFRKNPRASYCSSDDDNSRMVDNNHSRLDASSSEQPVSQVHITIGNSIQERFQEDTVSSAAFRSGHPLDSISQHHLDSIPEGNTHTMDTIDAHLAAGGGDTHNGDTLEMLVSREKYTIAPNSSEGDVSGAVRVQLKPPPAPGGPHHLSLVSAGEEEGQIMDGMYRVSMDHSAIESLPVLDSNPHDSRKKNGSNRRIFNPALQGGGGPLSNRTENGATELTPSEQYAAQLDAEAQADRILRHVSTNSVLDGTGFVGDSPVHSSGSGPDRGTGPASPLSSPGKRSGRHHLGDTTPSFLNPARSGSDHARGDTLSERFDILGDPAAVAMSSPFMPQPYPGTTSSTGVSTDVSPTLPPLSSAFVSATDMAGLQRRASSPRDHGTPIAAGSWSPFDVEPSSLTHASSAAASAGNGISTSNTGNGHVSPRDCPAASSVSAGNQTMLAPISPRHPSNIYMPPEHTEPPEGFENYPTLDMAQSPSFRVSDASLPISAIQASPFDKEPSAPSVALRSGSFSQSVSRDDCETAPFFRPGSGGALGSQAASSTAFQSAATVHSAATERASLAQVPEVLNDVTAGVSGIPSVSEASAQAHAHGQSPVTPTSGAAQVRSSPRYAPQVSPFSPPISPREHGTPGSLAAIAVAAAQQMSEQHQSPDDAIAAASAASIASHRLPVLAGAASSVGSFEGATASRAGSVEHSVFDQDPPIAPQISQYNSPFLKEPTPPQECSTHERSTHSSDRHSEWHNPSRSQGHGHGHSSHGGRTSQDRHRSRNGSDRHSHPHSSSHGRTTSSSHHSHHSHANRTTSQLSHFSTPGSHQTHSPPFIDAVAPVLAGAFDGPEPASAQTSHSGRGSTLGTYFSTPTADSVAPMLTGAFDIEPPSARAVGSATSSSPKARGVQQELFAPVLAGAFDVEPVSARGPDVTFGLRHVSGEEGVEGGAMVPVLPSMFDKEPSTASASGRALPITDVVTPDLPSLFDHEPAAAKQVRTPSGGVGVYMPDDVPAHSSGTPIHAHSHAGAGGASSSSPRRSRTQASVSSSSRHLHPHQSNSSAHHERASSSHSSHPHQHPHQRSNNGAHAPANMNNGSAPPPADRSQAYAAAYGLTPPPQAQLPDDRLSAFDVDPPISNAGQQHISISHQPTPPAHPGASAAFRSNPRSVSSAHGSHLSSSATGSTPHLGSTPHQRRNPSGQSAGGTPEASLYDLAMASRPRHRRTTSAHSWQGTPDTSTDPYHRPHERTSAGTPPLPPDALAELRLQHAQSTPGSSRHATPTHPGLFSHHQSPFFSGNSLSPEELLAVTREPATDPKSSRSNTSTPSFCDPTTPYERERERASAASARSSSQRASPTEVASLVCTPIFFPMHASTS